MQDIFKEIEARAEAEKLAKAQAEEEERSIKAVLKSKDGRRTLSWILSICALDSSITSTDGMLMASLSGRRDVGLVVASRLKEIDFDLFQLMLKEENNGRDDKRTDRH